jgi:hypothetical protein
MIYIDTREIGEAISDVLALVEPQLALTLDLHVAAGALAEDHDGGKAKARTRPSRSLDPS